MRIVIFNQYFSPDVAASAQRLTELAEDLAGRHSVTVIAGRPSYDPDQDARRPSPGGTLRVRRVFSTAFHRQRSVGRLANYLSYLACALVAGLSGSRPDLIVAATDPPLVGLVGRSIAVLRRVPFVQLLWDVQPQAAMAAGLLPSGAVASIVGALSARALRGADAVIVPTAEMKRSALACGARAGRVDAVPLWEDTTVITPQPRRNAFSGRQDLDDRFVVMYSGNLGLTQSLDVVLEVADRVRDMKGWMFVLVGEGAAKQGLREEASRRRLENVRFLPYTSRDQLSLSLAAADVFLVTLQEGLTRFMHPSKIFTIMASGRPVVAAIDRDSETARLIESERIGLVAPPGAAPAVEQHLRWLYARPEEREAMGVRARAAAEGRYARSVVTPRYLELLRRFEPAADHPGATVERPSHSRP